MKHLKRIAAVGAGAGAGIGLALTIGGAAALERGQAGTFVMIAGAVTFAVGAALLRAVLHEPEMSEEEWEAMK